MKNEHMAGSSLGQACFAPALALFPAVAGAAEKTQ
jgi:hypothetical protein